MSSPSFDREKWGQDDFVLLDIEGTISSISFVKDVLYPYAVRRLEELAHDSWDQDSFQTLVAGFPPEHRSDAKALLSHVEDLTRRDVKAVYLKQLQGQLWKSGYQSGELKSPLYPDVLPALHSWQARGTNIGIYSSGSVEAQNQFFGHVDSGDKTINLNPVLSDKFDTVTAGPKMEKDSYIKICEKLGRKPEQVTFFTDNVKEAQAASTANLSAILVHRPGNAELGDTARGQFRVVTSFEEVVSV